MSSDDVEHLVRQDTILEALKTYVGNEVSIQKIQVTRGTEEIVGYTSIILRVSVDFSHNGNVQSQSFIVKRLPQIDVQLKIVTENNIFTREIFYYQVIVPKLTKFLKSPLPLCACYFTQTDGVNDLLILEDLKSKGYKTLGFETNLSIDHCNLVMRELSKLHVSSVALEKETGEKLINVFPILQKDVLLDSGTLRPMLEESVNVINALCLEIPKFRRVSSVLSEKLSTMWDQLIEVLKPRPDQTNVLCHGDCGPHNMMFRFDENGKLSDVRLLDLQVVRYASPFTDILYFLYLSTTKDIRDKYLDEVLCTYISSYNTYARECGVSVEPLEFHEVKKNYNSVRCFGILMGCAFRPFIWLRNDVLPKNHTEDAEKFENMFYGERTSAAKAIFAKDEAFREEINAILTELCELYGIQP